MEQGLPDNRQDEKPLIVRVKRKAFQSAIDALWIEIHERPLKRTLLDFGKLSISEASSSRVEELQTKKILVKHVETVSSTEETSDVLRSFLDKSSDGSKSAEEIEKGRRNVISTNKHDQILAKAKERQEETSRHARFEQIWKSRRAKNVQSGGEDITEMCQLYDVVRVDDEDYEAQTQEDKEKHLEDLMMLSEFLPLLRDVLPNAASEIELDINRSVPTKDGYVYDFYTVKVGAEYEEDEEEEKACQIPLVQVEYDDYDDEDNYNGFPDSDSDDSNAENHPANDYPDEESSEDEDESSSDSRSDEENEDEDEDGDEEEDGHSGTTDEDKVDGHSDELELEDYYSGDDDLELEDFSDEDDDFDECNGRYSD